MPRLAPGASVIIAQVFTPARSIVAADPDEAHPFDEAFGRAVDLGNQIADDDEKADLWDIADGLLAGAVQYWLYTRQPCGDPRCEDCLAIGNVEKARFAISSSPFASATICCGVPA